MLKRLREFVNTKRFGLKTLTTVGLSFMVAGLLVASGLSWTAPSVGKVMEGVAKDGVDLAGCAGLLYRDRGAVEPDGGQYQGDED